MEIWYIYTVEYYSAVKKDEIITFAGKWMDLGNIFNEVDHWKTNAT